MTLRIASFGVRGFVGTSLTPKVAMDFTGAFAAHLGGGRVLLGRDTRGSSRMLHSAVTSSLVAAGCEVPAATPRENLQALCEPVPYIKK